MEQKSKHQAPDGLAPQERDTGCGNRSANPCNHDWEDLDYMFLDTADGADSGMKVLQHCRHCWLERVIKR